MCLGVHWGSGPNFKAFRIAWSSPVKVSRVRGPIVFGWSLLLQRVIRQLSHKKINNIYQTQNIFSSKPLRKYCCVVIYCLVIRNFGRRIPDCTRRLIPSTIHPEAESPVNSTIKPPNPSFKNQRPIIYLSQFGLLLEFP